MTVTKPYALILLVSVLFCVWGAARAHLPGLTQENIREFYKEMVMMNTTLREGFEDLPVFLEYMDRILADDFRHISKFREQCTAVPSEGSIMTKERLLKTYEEIGIDNFDKYEMHMKTIEISEDQQTAEVHYTLHIEDASGGAPFITTCETRASLVWDEEYQAPRIAEQECKQTFALGLDKQACEQPEKTD